MKEQNPPRVEVVFDFRHEATPTAPGTVHVRIYHRAALVPLRGQARLPDLHAPEGIRQSQRHKLFQFHVLNCNYFFATLRSKDKQSFSLNKAIA